MPYCPECRAEYRAEIQECAHCEGALLVESLPERAELSPERLADTLPVGREGSSNVVTLPSGAELDQSKIFPLAAASEIARHLHNSSIASLIVPLDVDLPHELRVFEVRVLQTDHGRAESLLLAQWSSLVEQEGAGASSAEVAIDQCPACGSDVPLDAEECPDCGLFVGAA